MPLAQRTDTHPTDGFTRYCGIEETHLLEDGRVEAVIDVREEHLNEGGVVHGGLLATALDVVMGSAVVATLDLEGGEWCATQSLTTDFVRPVTDGTIRAVGEIDRRGSLAANVSGEVLDEEGRVCARATGVWAVRRSPGE